MTPISTTTLDTLLCQAAEIDETIATLSSAFTAIQQPRSSFQIEHFVVGQHDTPERQYMQCVLEMQFKYTNIRRSLIDRALLQLDIDDLLNDTSPRAPLELQKKRLSIEELDLALLGTIREFHVLHAIYQSFPHFTYQQLQHAETDYWQRRLTRQAQQDIQATGRVGVGNLDALRQLTTPVGTDPSLSPHLSPTLPPPHEQLPPIT